VETPLKDEHIRAGATLAEYSGCLLPESFSGFDQEYVAARETAAILDTNWHAVIRLAGPDRVRYLNAVTSNNIQSLAEGSGILALLLNPQGHILAELEVYNLPEKLLVLTHASVRERTVATLDKYIIMDDVELEDLTDQVGSFAIEGPRAASIVKQACGIALDELPEMAIQETAVERIPCQLLRRSHYGETGAEILARLDRLHFLWGKFNEAIRAHGGQPIGMSALNSLRLEAGIPWFPVDFDDRVIPHEAALEETHISFTKGCYTGQEIVERVRSQGRVNRRRVRVQFSTKTAPPGGTKLSAKGAEMGAVTSAAFSPSAGAAIGMGYVHREYTEPGSVLEFDGGTARVVS